MSKEIFSGINLIGSLSKFLVCTGLSYHNFKVFTIFIPDLPLGGFCILRVWE